MATNYISTTGHVDAVSSDNPDRRFWPVGAQDIYARHDGNRWQAMRTKAHRLKRKQGIEFKDAFDQVAREQGFRDSQHATHWLIPQEWWGPCEPPKDR